VVACTCILAGCASQMEGLPSSAANPLPPSVMPHQIVGRWGLASYHRDPDRPRMGEMAGEQCGKAYVAPRGPPGGVRLHVPDKREQTELVTKGAAGGKTFIGPPGEAGGELDREIMSFDNKVMVLRWVDQEVASRYGTMIYVRCDQRR